MIDETANATLELACTVGSFDTAKEALEEGADVNCRGGAPIFLAIMNRDRQILNLLLDHGAEGTCFIAKKKQRSIKTRDDLLNELIACAPHNPRDVKPEIIAEIDNAIRSNGVEILIAELDWDHATRFRDALNAIGANSTHRTIAEFLHWTQAENGASRDHISEFLVKNEGAVQEYRDRYLTSGEDLVALANTYVSDEV